MPTQDDVRGDDRYIRLHKHGFVGLVETMGSDESVEEAARVSYGKGTRKRGDTRTLLRYLIKNHHTSPIEMCEVKFHIKLPIFVMRQLVRHRTASLNEYSGRYSEMSDEFYVPPALDLVKQSKSNKQGRDEDDLLPEVEQSIVLSDVRAVQEHSLSNYKKFLERGLTRELARIVLPVSNYTECYWKIDLKNFMGFLKLRCDSHAQKEIRDYAWAMHELSKPHFPILFEAWHDYQFESVTFSTTEQQVLSGMIFSKLTVEESIAQLVIRSYRTPKKFEMTKREISDFKHKLNNLCVEKRR